MTRSVRFDRDFQYRMTAVDLVMSRPDSAQESCRNRYLVHKPHGPEHLRQRNFCFGRWLAVPAAHLRHVTDLFQPLRDFSSDMFLFHGVACNHSGRCMCSVRLRHGGRRNLPFVIRAAFLRTEPAIVFPVSAHQAAGSVHFRAAHVTCHRRMIGRARFPPRIPPLVTARGCAKYPARLAPAVSLRLVRRHDQLTAFRARCR